VSHPIAPRPIAPRPPTPTALLASRRNRDRSPSAGCSGPSMPG